MKKVVVKTSKSVVKGYLDALITTIGYGYAEQIGILRPIGTGHAKGVEVNISA